MLLLGLVQGTMFARQVTVARLATTTCVQLGLAHDHAKFGVVTKSVRVRIVEKTQLSFARRRSRHLLLLVVLGCCAVERTRGVHI